MADVMVTAPGLSARQVATQVTEPLERLVSQIDGVEYVYSSSHRDQAVVTVRFYVGEDREDSLVKLYNKLYSNQDIIPAVVSNWVVKPVEIDDVANCCSRHLQYRFRANKMLLHCAALLNKRPNG